MRFWSFGTFALSSRSRLPKHWSDEPLVTNRRHNNIIIFFGSFGHVRLEIFSRNRQKTDAPICFCETPFDYKIIMHNVFVVIKVVFFFFFFHPVTAIVGTPMLLQEQYSPNDHSFVALHRVFLWEVFLSHVPLDMMRYSILSVVMVTWFAYFVLWSRNRGWLCL